MGRGSEQPFSPKRHIDDQQVHENVLTVTNHQGIANQNYNEILPYIYQNGYYQQDKKKVLMRTGEKGNLVHYWQESKLVQSLGKTVWTFFKKLKIELPYDPAIPLLVIYQKKMKTLTQKHICTLMFIAALFTIGKA